MIVSQVSVLIELGQRNVSVGLKKLDGAYAVYFRDMIEPAKPDTIVTSKDVDSTSDLVMISFPTLEQAVKVKAAIVGKSEEDVLAIWNRNENNSQVRRQIWTEVVNAGDLLDEQ